MLDPPGSIGGKLSSLRRIETLDSLHQADVSLRDQVKEWQPQIGIITCDLHHEAKICTDHFRFGRLISLLDLGCKGNLLSRGQEWVLGDLPQVELES